MHFLTSITIFITEFFIKNEREKNTKDQDYLNGNIRITTYHNQGAFLNEGDSNPINVTIISAVLTFFLTIFMFQSYSKKGKKELRLPLSLLLGGALSNSYDRLKNGFVVDYLQFPKLPRNFKNVVYNLSDFCIFLGGILLCKRCRDSDEE